ncbi:MAG: flagellar biosynthesis protein FlhA [Pyrinomonadaceae bacterium]
MSKGTNFTQSIWDSLKGGRAADLFEKVRPIILPLAGLVILATLIIPIPPEVISILVLLSLAFSIMVYWRAFNINSPTELTSFPTVLLLAAVVRFAISLSATRSILTQGYAGSVIDVIGHITTGGSVIVGAVMFIMILVVMFIVVAKGAERVSEVAARFTLDAMPGKQMAIDADLRSGLITQDVARAHRTELQKESQLHGAMDGAMKFVKGDSIATIVLALVNFSAGMMVGIFSKGMSAEQALEKFTIMTIGDALAAMISSALITISAGLVVTRVAAGDEKTNIGADITQQFMLSPQPLFVVGGLFILITPFSILAGGVGVLLAGAGFLLYRQQKATANEVSDFNPQDSLVGGGANDELQPTFTVPLAIVVSTELTHLIDKDTPTGSHFRNELPKLRAAMYYDLGVMLPYCHVTGDAPLKPYQYFIALKEVPVGYGFLRPDCVYVNDSAENIRVFGLEGENVMNPADLKPGSWIPAHQRNIAETAGLKVWEPADVITLHLSRVMKKYVHEFVGIQETQGYLDFASRGVPKLVEEVVPKVVSIHQLTDVLQRLVQESVSIRDIKSILDALAEWGRVEKDPVMLTEYIRSSMRRYISFRFTSGKDTLFVYLLDPEIEDVIRGAIRRTSTGAFLSLDPSITHDILDAIRREVANLPPTAQQPVIVTDMELRRFVRKMVELEFPHLAVVSFQELTPELNVQPIGRVSMRPASVNNDFAQIENEFAEFSLLES